EQQIAVAVHPLAGAFQVALDRRDDGSPTCAWVHPRTGWYIQRSPWLSHVRVGSPFTKGHPIECHRALPRARGFTDVGRALLDERVGTPPCASVQSDMRGS